MGEPFEEKSHHLQEMVNELVIMMSMYHFLCFSPFVPSISARAYIGYSLSGVLTFYLLFNLFKVIITNIREGIKWIQRYQLKMAQIKRVAERKLVRMRLLRGSSSFESWRKFRTGKGKKPDEDASANKKKGRRRSPKKPLPTI
jgi:hypothetical protein